jgi:uncharacterized protein YcfJ
MSSSMTRSVTPGSVLARDLRLDGGVGRAQARSYGILLLLAGAALIATDATAGNPHHGHGGPAIEYAKVVDVQPLIRLVRTEVPVRECYETTAWRQVPVNGHGHGPAYASAPPSRAGVIGGTIAGGVIGGLIGDRFGGGEGRDAMRLLGTLVGATVGHETAVRRAGWQQAAAAPPPAWQSEPYPVTECTTRYEHRSQEVTDGYRVTYRYKGRDYVTHTPEHPGSRIPVEVDVRPAW